MATPGGLRLRPTTAFDRDVKQLRKRGKALNKLRDLAERLGQGLGLVARHRDHPLGGDWQGWRDCHLEPDWVLVYRVDEDAGELILGRTGTHSDLFG